MVCGNSSIYVDKETNAETADAFVSLSTHIGTWHYLVITAPFNNVLGKREQSIKHTAVVELISVKKKAHAHTYFKIKDRNVNIVKVQRGPARMGKRN